MSAPHRRQIDDLLCAPHCEPPDYVCALEWEHQSIARTVLSRRIRNRDTIRACAVDKSQPVPFWDEFPVKILRCFALRSADGARFLTSGSCSCLRGGVACELFTAGRRRGRRTELANRRTVRTELSKGPSRISKVRASASAISRALPGQRRQRPIFHSSLATTRGHAAGGSQATLSRLLRLSASSSRR